MRKVFTYCELDWEPGRADITRDATPCATLSAAQVRSPLHYRAFEGWRRYASRLQPLREALIEHGIPVLS